MHCLLPDLLAPVFPSFLILLWSNQLYLLYIQGRYVLIWYRHMIILHHPDALLLRECPVSYSTYLILSLWPTLRVDLVVIPFNRQIVAIGTRYFLLIVLNVSPDFTL